MQLHRRTVARLSVVSLLGLSSIASGQACLGRSMLTTRTGRIGGSYAQPAHENTWGADGAVGFGRSAFAGIGYSRTSVDQGSQPDLIVNGITAQAGVGIEAKAASLCPIVEVGYQAASSSQGPISAAAHVDTYAAGAAIGLPTSTEAGVEWIPSVALLYVDQRSTTMIRGSVGSNRLSASSPIGLARATLGVVIHQRFTIGPTFALPFATPQARGYAGVAGSVSFGRVDPRLPPVTKM